MRALPICRYPDTLVIGSQVLQPVEQGADRFVLQSSAYSLKAWEEYQRKVNALAAKVQQDVDRADTSEGQPRIPGPVCTADQLCVSYDYDKLSKAPLPEDLRLVSTVEGGGRMISKGTSIGAV